MISPDLWAMAPRAQTIALEWFEAGYVAGVEVGRRLEEAELAAIQRVAVASARGAADRGPFALAAERRGEHERAARQRALLADRGIS
ncbi:hypothetical protein ACPYO6_08105 [Georgenia sp. Z1344]|uniref:hypothetical protein n=1 Tax=Georgenia sp. Z1344 TaxID=3416706 RepID=UPI003CE7041F